MLFFFLDKSITSLKVRKPLRPYGQTRIQSSQLKRLVASASTAHVCRSTLAPMASIGNRKLTFPDGKVTPGDIYRKQLLSIFVVLRITLQKKNGTVFSLKPTEMMLLIFPLWAPVKTQPSKSVTLTRQERCTFWVLILSSKRSLGQEGKFLGRQKQAVSKQPRIRWLKLSASHENGSIAISTRSNFLEHCQLK